MCSAPTLYKLPSDASPASTPPNSASPPSSSTGVVSCCCIAISLLPYPPPYSSIFQNANEQTGASVPMTVISKHGRLPQTSLNLPNNGHAKKASMPRTHSAAPITIYVCEPYRLSNKEGNTARVNASARNSRSNTGSTAKWGCVMNSWGV